MAKNTRRIMDTYSTKYGLLSKRLSSLKKILGEKAEGLDVEVKFDEIPSIKTYEKLNFITEKLESLSLPDDEGEIEFDEGANPEEETKRYMLKELKSSTDDEVSMTSYESNVKMASFEIQKVAYELKRFLDNVQVTCESLLELDSDIGTTELAGYFDKYDWLKDVLDLYEFAETIAVLKDSSSESRVKLFEKVIEHEHSRDFLIKLIESEHYQSFSEEIVCRLTKSFDDNKYLDDLWYAKEREGMYYYANASVKHPEKYDLAINKFDEVLKLKPQDFTIMYYRGLCYQYMGDFDNAKEAFQKIQKEIQNSNFYDKEEVLKHATNHLKFVSKTDVSKDDISEVEGDKSRTEDNVSKVEGDKSRTEDDISKVVNDLFAKVEQNNLFFNAKSFYWDKAEDKKNIKKMIHNLIKSNPQQRKGNKDLYNDINDEIAKAKIVLREQQFEQNKIGLNIMEFSRIPGMEKYYESYKFKDKGQEDLYADYKDAYTQLKGVEDFVQEIAGGIIDLY